MTVCEGGVVEIHLRLPPREISYLKAVVESYEGMAVIRTIDRHEAIVAVLVAPDFLPLARRVLDSIQPEIGWQEIPEPRGALK